MRVLFVDCFSGISGDMFLGGLFDLGIDEKAFREEIAKLNLNGYEIIIEKKTKHGITATDVNVITGEMAVHTHSHSHNHARNLMDIETIIDNSSLNDGVKYISKEIFKEIARAEAKVHEKDIYEIHFHEVGAIDSIIDIVGVAICTNMLNVERIYSSPLNEGYGMINCQHGILPVPVPAVAEMLSGSRIPIVQTRINTELITPTGVAIIKTLACYFGKMPSMFIEKVGYGLGKRDTGSFNALRVVIGDLFEQDYLSEDTSLIETNIDDLAPEIMSFTMERLLEVGALDVYFTSIQMKKNRPGVMLSVICNIVDEDKMSEIIFKETSSIGLRVSKTSRKILKRINKEVDTKFGKANIKISDGFGVSKASPEYEDCRKIALENNVPLREVYQEVYSQYNKS